MVVGACEITLQLPDNRSLKGKRQVSRSLVQRIRNRFNVAVSEVADQDRWQTLSLGITCVTDDPRYANEILSKVLDFVDGQISSAVVQHSRIEILRS
ncbi:MAG TPA: DUF503 domain-containing protein [Candidatus Limnocylindria bacterium]|nr:DUF503 domain-containing protein [Candidatus Limnocylindria bacterium]